MAFLVLEGLDASGKSLLLERLCQVLKEKGLFVVKTREPGGTKTGEVIRNILLSRENTQINSLTETLLYYADRKQHIEEVIQPSLKKNLWVISDRYWASTSAYQCGGRNIDENMVQQLQQLICKNCEPDLWILLDLPVEESLNRLALSKANHRDRMEMEEIDFYQRVRDYYLKLAKQEPYKWLVIPATQSPNQVFDQVLSELKKKGLLQ